MSGRTRNAALNEAREVLIPRTLPARSPADYRAYHFVRDDAGNLTLRQGPPPAKVRQAAAAFGAGNLTLNEFLDAAGVPKS